MDACSLSLPRRHSASSLIGTESADPPPRRPFAVLRFASVPINRHLAAQKWNILLLPLPLLKAHLSDADYRTLERKLVGQADM